MIYLRNLIDRIPSMLVPSVPSMRMFQVAGHSALIYLLFTGTALEWMVCLFVYLLQVSVGGTVTLHRLLAHKAFKSPKWFEYIGSLIVVVGNYTSPLAWVALHREHHAFTDTEKDPHSPLFFGYWRIQFRSMDRLPRIKFVPDLLRSKFHMFIHKYFSLIILSHISILCIIDPRAVVYAWLVPGILIWHASSLINTLNHSPLGYKNYNTKDVSVNNPFTGLVSAGEGWHNNHHAQPANPNFGHKWWEFDLGYQIIKLVRIK